MRSSSASPVLSVSWRTEDGVLTGTVTNEGTLPVEDLAYVSSSGGDMILAELDAGESAEFTVETTNFNGSSASDQVYGFGGFDGADEAQRQVLIRRQVIDALVGFGGFMPGIELGSVGSRGPFLIGWRDEPGPLPVMLDGLDARRYAHTVEVVSVGPTFGPGEARIRPAQMGVAVLSTEGGASSAGPGTVLLGDGSATYSIALPLEAADMTVSELEILVGPDPSMVLGDQGQMPGMWPRRLHAGGARPDERRLEPARRHQPPDDIRDRRSEHGNQRGRTHRGARHRGRAGSELRPA